METPQNTQPENEQSEYALGLSEPEIAILEKAKRKSDERSAVARKALESIPTYYVDNGQVLLPSDVAEVQNPARDQTKV